MKPHINDWFERSLLYIDMRKKADNGKDPCVALTPDSEEWKHWAVYLWDRYSALPRFMRLVEEGKIPTGTFPAQWPDWFDSEYVRPDEVLYVPKAKELTPKPAREQIARVDAMIASWKKGLIKDIGDA
jgi:hypothetical protein